MILITDCEDSDASEFEDSDFEVEDVDYQDFSFNETTAEGKIINKTAISALIESFDNDYILSVNIFFITLCT